MYLSHYINQLSGDDKNEKKLSLLAITLCSIISSINANAATSTFGNCNTPGFITATNSGGPLTTYSLNTTTGYALVLIGGSYCAILGTTAGESALIRSMAQQAYKANLKFAMRLEPISGNVEAYTLLP